jgi:hypothetical protein
MLVRQQHSDAGLFSTSRKRKLKLQKPNSSPLLLISSKPEVTRDWPCSDAAVRGNDCSEADPVMQV